MDSDRPALRRRIATLILLGFVLGPSTLAHAEEDDSPASDTCFRTRLGKAASLLDDWFSAKYFDRDHYEKSKAEYARQLRELQDKPIKFPSEITDRTSSVTPDWLLNEDRLALIDAAAEHLGFKTGRAADATAAGGKVSRQLQLRMEKLIQNADTGGLNPREFEQFLVEAFEFQHSERFKSMFATWPKDAAREAVRKHVMARLIQGDMTELFWELGLIDSQAASNKTSRLARWAERHKNSLQALRSAAIMGVIRKVSGELVPWLPGLKTLSRAKIPPEILEVIRKQGWDAAAPYMEKFLNRKAARELVLLVKKDGIEAAKPMIEAHFGAAIYEEIAKTYLALKSEGGDKWFEGVENLLRQKFARSASRRARFDEYWKRATRFVAGASLAYAGYAIASGFLSDDPEPGEANAPKKPQNPQPKEKFLENAVQGIVNAHRSFDLTGQGGWPDPDSESIREQIEAIEFETNRAETEFRVTQGEIREALVRKIAELKAKARPPAP